MKDMEYLTEKDLEYFRKKEKEGEAVILYIDTEKLLSFDPKKFGEIKNDLNENEIERWLREHDLILENAYKNAKSVSDENRMLREFSDNGEQEKKRQNMDFLEIIADVKLSEEQWLLLEKFVLENKDTLSKEQLLLFFREDISREKIQALKRIIETVSI